MISNTDEYKLEEGCIVMRPTEGGYIICIQKRI